LGVYILAGTPACFVAGLVGLVWGSWVTASWFWMLAAVMLTYVDSNRTAVALEGVEMEPSVEPSC